MIRISKLADYAVALMAQMAQGAQETRTSTGLSEATGVSLPTVTKLLKQLAKGGLLSATRGKSGGYKLSRDGSMISLLDIIQAIDGPVGLTECCAAEGVCSREAVCSPKRAMREVSAAISQALRSVSLESVARQPAASAGPASFATMRRADLSKGGDHVQ